MMTAFVVECFFTWGTVAVLCGGFLLGGRVAVRSPGQFRLVARQFRRRIWIGVFAPVMMPIWHLLAGKLHPYAGPLHWERGLLSWGIGFAMACLPGYLVFLKTDRRF